MTQTANSLLKHREDERIKPPFLRRMRIRGYKSIAACDVLLQPLTVLVGRNASGKSNFLDALAFLSDIMKYSAPDAVNRRGGWSGVACRTSALEPIRFDVEVGFPPWLPFFEGNEPFSNRNFVLKYRMDVSPDANGVPTLARESLKIFEALDQIGGFEVANGRLLSWQPILGQSSGMDLFRNDVSFLAFVGTRPEVDFRLGLRCMGFYNFIPDEIRKPQAADNPVLERSGRNLARAIEQIEKVDTDGFQRIQDYLSTIAPEVQSFEIVHYDQYETIRFRMRSSGEQAPKEFNAASMSDGTLRALAALAAVFQRPPPPMSVVGIEEPETSLHPAAMHSLVDALQEASDQTQVILTTHSAEILADRELDPSQVLVVRMRDGETQIAPMDAGSREIIRKELYTLADLQRMDQLELDEADLARQSRNGED